MAGLGRGRLRAGPLVAAARRGGARGRVIILDTALAERERGGEPVRVGLIGAGYMGRAITRQLLTSVPGMRLVAVASRSADDAEAAFTSVGADEVARVSNSAELAAAIERGGRAATDDAL